MNNSTCHEPLSEDGLEEDPDFSSRYVFNPNRQDWVLSHINKPYIYAGNRFALD